MQSKCVFFLTSSEQERDHLVDLLGIVGTVKEKVATGVDKQLKEKITTWD